MTVYFDDSLPLFMDIVIRELGVKALADGVMIRDTSGRLCFYAAEVVSDDRKRDIAALIERALGNYARKDQVIADISDFGSDNVLNASDAISIEIKDISVRLIDRRLVGADWLHPLVRRTSGAPRYVFASLKGGVGRSTALSIVASHVASRGRRVLAVDLDMEAPGLGAILLDNDTTPQFGIIDALVERALAPLDDSFLAELVGPSTLSNRGQIDVVPAFGSRSLANPADILAKIGRAYGEAVQSDGSVETILDQVAAIISALEKRNRYDVILIDARAGLHETAAAALLGLGAEILCFGLDEPQTFHGYRALFSHMERYVKNKAAETDWLARICLVQAKSPVDPELRSDFSQKCRQMLSDIRLKSSLTVRGQVPLPDGFSEVEWDETVEDAELGLTDTADASDVISVIYNTDFSNFAPLKFRAQIAEKVYSSTYGGLLEYVDQGISRTEKG